MSNAFFSLPDDLIGWITLITADILGLFAIFGVVDRTKKQQQKESQELARDIIDGLKEKISLLEDTLSSQQGELTDFKAQLLQITMENKVMKDILQGRDQAATSYYEKGTVAMSQIAEILNATKENSKNIERLYAVIEKHLKNMEEK